MAVLYSFLNQSTSLAWGSNSTPNTVVGFTWTPGYNGNLNGLYFYKLASDTGPHTAFCWNETGPVLLGSALFAGETATGWQYQAFSSPIPVVANTNYRIAVSRNVANWASTTPGMPSRWCSGR